MKRSPLIILAVTLFLDMLGFGLILPLLPVYITHYGGKPWVGGALMACFSLMQFIFSPIWGRMSDRHGRRPLILLSLCGSATSFLAFGLAPNLTVLFIARICAGILSAASLPTAQAYIADVTTPEKRAGGMAVLGASFGLGFAFGPIIAGYSSQFSLFGSPPLSTPAYVAAMLCALNFIWALFMLPESHDAKAREEQKGGEHAERSVLSVFPDIARAMRSPAVSAQLLVFAFTTFAFVALESSFSWLVVLRFHGEITQTTVTAWQHAHHGRLWASLPIATQTQLIEQTRAAYTSRIFKIVGVALVLVQVGVMRGLARKVGENRLVMFGSCLLAFTLLGIGMAHSFFVIELLAICVAIDNGVMNPSLSALITQSAGPQERGTLSGAQQGLGGLARIIAPPINNDLIQTNTGIPFFSSAALMGIAFLLALRLKPLLSQQKGTTEPTGTPEAPVQPVSEI
jgi:MFS transporter, DHA1 family, tetracycline resistance protein